MKSIRLAYLFGQLLSMEDWMNMILQILQEYASQENNKVGESIDMFRQMWDELEEPKFREQPLIYLGDNPKYNTNNILKNSHPFFFVAHELLEGSSSSKKLIYGIIYFVNSQLMMQQQIIQKPLFKFYLSEAVEAQQAHKDRMSQYSFPLSEEIYVKLLDDSKKREF